MLANIDLIFPTVVYKAENILEEDYRNKLIHESYNLQEKIPNQADVNKWNCKIYTNYGNNELQNNSLYDSILHEIGFHVNHFAQELNSNATYNLENAWLNIATKDNFQEHHRHAGACFSAVYYLQAPEGSGDLIFENPAGFMPQLLNLSDVGLLNENSHSYKPVENSLIIFRSHIQHMVALGSNTKERISIAANFK